MNPFNTMEGILGDTKTAYLDRALDEFLSQCRVIRDRLGKQTYIFDHYLSLLFGAVNSKTVRDVKDECFGKEAPLLMCLEILRHKPKDTANPIYDTIKDYIDANPLPYQEEATQQAIYCSMLAGEILESMANLFKEVLTESFRAAVDIVDLRDLHRKICAILGGEKEMEKLNVLFRQRFILATPTAIFMQSVTNQLIALLLQRDCETSKQVFQLILDEVPKLPERLNEE